MMGEQLKCCRQRICITGNHTGKHRIAEALYLIKIVVLDATGTSLYFPPSHQSDVTDLSFITTAGLEVIWIFTKFSKTFVLNREG